MVVKSDLEGGGRDYLNDKNSHTFDTYEESHKALIYAVENYQSFEIDNTELIKEIRADHSLESLKRYLKELYQKNNQEFDGKLINTDNLNRRFPAHYYDETVFWSREKKYRFSTTDIISYSQFSRLYNKMVNPS